ncbi:Type III effector HopPmaJ [hydrothermal vent metagenome]|uniref:Type III effector HopPmaJ n=1 Tax=hydrothermal vent metagenome TaxID=652676 RepID=A0A3B0Z539_9ZZZZ
MTLEEFINNLQHNPQQISFEHTMKLIDELYIFKPVSFRNGNIENAIGENSGSCKLLAFAKLNKLSKLQTLQCFGDYYRIDVLGSPEGDNHQNIRNFMQTAWEGIAFTEEPLTAR